MKFPHLDERYFVVVSSSGAGVWIFSQLFEALKRFWHQSLHAAFSQGGGANLSAGYSGQHLAPPAGVRRACQQDLLISVARAR